MKYEVYFLHADIHQSLLQVDARSTQNKSAYLCNISIKVWGMKLIFCLQINISFLQDDGITLGVLSQGCPKYPKQQVYNIFAICQGKHEG